MSIPCILLISNSFTQISVVGNQFLVFAMKEGITGWTIANLPMTGGDTVVSNEPQTILPLFRVPYDMELSTTDSSSFTEVFPLSQWYSTNPSAGQSLILPLDVTVASLAPGVDFICSCIRRSQFSIRIGQGAVPQTSHTILSHFVLDSDVHDSQNVLSYRPPAMSSGYLSTLIWSPEPNRRVLHKILYAPLPTIPPPTAHREPLEQPCQVQPWRVVSLEPTAHLTSVISNLCPSSGRMAYHCWSQRRNHRSRWNGIYLIDYLSTN